MAVPRAFFFDERFNENHDPDNGEFSDGDGGSGGGKDSGKGHSSSKSHSSSKGHSSSKNESSSSSADDKALEHAVDWYQENGYKTINNALRGGGKLPTRVANSVKSLDKAIKAHTEAKAITVYRGIKGKKFNASAFTSGKTITLKGYSSTTANKKVADLFAVVNGAHPVRFEISVPKGSHTLHTADLVKNTRSNTEKEVILPRNAKFKVGSIKKTKAFSGDELTVIHLDLVK